MDDLRKKLVNSYFLEKPRPDYLPLLICAIGGVFVFIVGTKQTASDYSEAGEITTYITRLGWQVIAFGLSVVAVSVILMFQKHKIVLGHDKREKATDQQMDEWLDSDQQMVLKESLQALDMDSDDSSAWPLMIGGPHKDARRAVGDDKMLRYSAHSILIFYLTEHHVATFKCKLDMAVGCIIEQNTSEFSYKDITNLETVTRNTSMKIVSGRKIAAKGDHEFSLYTSGHNRISISYLFSKSSTSEDDYILPPSDAETTVKAIRKRLKEYKERFTPGVTELSASI